MKRVIDVFEYTGEILKAVKGGVLLTTMADGRVNTMTISWGTLGIEWGKPIFTTFIREHRFTKQLLDKNPEFTVNIPYGTFDKDILKVCGTKSGRDTDKVKDLGLTLENADSISGKAIRELPLTLECKVVYVQKQEESAMHEAYQKACYPKDVDGTFFGANRDYHTAYYGEFVRAYILE